jgi:hypothetical protein
MGEQSNSNQPEKNSYFCSSLTKEIDFAYLAEWASTLNTSANSTYIRNKRRWAHEEKKSSSKKPRHVFLFEYSLVSLKKCFYHNWKKTGNGPFHDLFPATHFFTDLISFPSLLPGSRQLYFSPARNFLANSSCSRKIPRPPTRPTSLLLSCLVCVKNVWVSHRPQMVTTSTLFSLFSHCKIWHWIFFPITFFSNMEFALFHIIDLMHFEYILAYLRGHLPPPSPLLARFMPYCCCVLLGWEGFQLQLAVYFTCTALHIIINIYSAEAIITTSNDNTRIPRHKVTEILHVFLLIKHVKY